ncbi:L-rhamnose mutarotase [Dactylosporangium sp. CA-139114]|uniref:L-rhamnose mutarotase n=1 Tax=Dactylosporangium sp. CA-139114 TaxID=3239931 RepID=UPI003D99165C
MRRYCFTLQVKPELLEEYRRRHAHVWPEMLVALRGAGWHEYQLFLRDDGLLVGTLLADDLAAAQAAMDATEVSARWEAQMAQFFIHGRRLVVLDEVFNLEHQLGALQ